MPVFGTARPLLFDAVKKLVLDVYPSIDALMDDFRLRALNPAPTDRLVEAVIRDAGLESCSALLRSIYGDAAQLVSPASVTRDATAMMEAAVSGAIEEQAAREGMAARTGRILFARGKEKLGRNGKRRLARWGEQAPFLRQAYVLKEAFAEIWSHGKLRGWPAWAAAAHKLEGIDYGPVVALVERNLEGLQSFIREAGKKTGIAAYQKKADEIAGLQFEGVYSFAGARAAVLSKYGVQVGLSADDP